MIVCVCSALFASSEATLKRQRTDPTDLGTSSPSPAADGPSLATPLAASGSIGVDDPGQGPAAGPGPGWTPARCLYNLLFPSVASLREQLSLPGTSRLAAAYVKGTAPEDMPLWGLAQRVRGKFGVPNAGIVIVLDGLQVLRRLLLGQLVIRATSKLPPSSSASGSTGTPLKATPGTQYASPLRWHTGAASVSGGGPPLPDSKPQAEGFSMTDALVCLAMSQQEAMVPADATGSASALKLPAAEFIRKAFFAYLYNLHHLTACCVHVVFPSEDHFLVEAAFGDPTPRCVSTRVKQALAKHQPDTGKPNADSEVAVDLTRPASVKGVLTTLSTQ